jgi:hypothetical protein
MMEGDGVKMMGGARVQRMATFPNGNVALAVNG